MKNLDGNHSGHWLSLQRIGNDDALWLWKPTLQQQYDERNNGDYCHHGRYGAKKSTLSNCPTMRHQ
ncbi:MAG: hypothetical protein ACLTZY_07625 [Alistipes indistinctus]